MPAALLYSYTETTWSFTDFALVPTTWTIADLALCAHLPHFELSATHCPINTSQMIMRPFGWCPAIFYCAVLGHIAVAIVQYSSSPFGPVEWQPNTASYWYLSNAAILVQSPR